MNWWPHLERWFLAKIVFCDFGPPMVNGTTIQSLESCQKERNNSRNVFVLKRTEG